MNITDKELNQLREQFYREALTEPTLEDGKQTRRDFLLAVEPTQHADMQLALKQFLDRRLDSLLPRPPQEGPNVVERCLSRLLFVMEENGYTEHIGKRGEGRVKALREAVTAALWVFAEAYRETAIRLGGENQFRRQTPQGIVNKVHATTMEELLP